MGLETIKLELIEWLTKLENKETLQYLKVVKDSESRDTDWWSSLSVDVRQGIERGLKDVEEGRVTAHDELKKKYGL